MNFENDVSYNSLEGVSVEQIAETLFNKMPDDTTIKQLIFDIPNNETNSGTYMYEILLTLLLEGIMKFKNNLENVNLSDIHTFHITALNPWFKSLKFNLKVDELSKSDEDQYKYYYAKIILKKMPEYEMLFNINHITKNYTFLLNSLYVREKYPFHNLNDIYSVLFLENRVFKIKFDIISDYK